MSQITHDQHTKLIHHYARRAQRRLLAAGARGLVYEDIVQEINVAWVVARNAYNPEHGVPFAAFFSRGVWRQINRWIEKEIGQSALTPLSLDEPTGESEQTVHQIMPASAEPQDTTLSLKQHRDHILSRLTPIARAVIELLDAPPEPIVAELKAMQAKSAYARQRGFHIFAPGNVTLRMIMDILGLTATERSKVHSELKSAIAMSEKVNQ